MDGPKVVCVACGEVGVSIFTPLCDECAKHIELPKFGGEAGAQKP